MHHFTKRSYQLVELVWMVEIYVLNSNFSFAVFFNVVNAILRWFICGIQIAYCMYAYETNSLIFCHWKLWRNTFFVNVFFIINFATSPNIPEIRNRISEEIENINKKL